MFKSKKIPSNTSKKTGKPMRRQEIPPTGKRPSAMVVQAGESDEEAIRGFIDACFIPILAERFLSEQ
jgi:hypothetical protein